jgi:hypothetical protein
MSMMGQASSRLVAGAAGALAVCVLGVISVLLPEPCLAETVGVTLKLDTNQVAPGQTTVLRVYAQILPAERAVSDRIFSWYVDLLDANGAAAQIQATGLAKSASDNDPSTSGSGTMDGPNLRGVYDTFMNLPGAGKDALVELFSVPVQGVSAGTSLFSVQAGTTVDGLGDDFIVAPAGGGDPLVGGDYSAAGVTLRVSGSATPVLRIHAVPSPDRQSVQATLTFTPTAGTDYFVEYRDALGTGTGWQTLPGAPHNSGTVTDNATASHRFYRLRVGP